MMPLLWKCGFICGLTVACLASITNSNVAKDGSNQSSTLVVEVGGNVSINCYQGHNAYTTSQQNIIGKEKVIWRRKNKIVDKYWTDVSNNREEIWYSGDNLVLTNVSLDFSGIYGCFWENSSLPLNKIYLQIGYPPQPPFGISCETNGHLTLMTCCWQGGRETHLNTSYRMDCRSSRFASHQIPLQPGSQKLWPCERSRSGLQSIVCCSVSLIPITETYLNSPALLPTYTVQVNASNALGHTNSLPSIEVPQMWVTPNPPRNVSIARNGQTAGHRSTSLRVQWIAPDVSSLIDLVYKLRYRISFSADSWHTVERITETSYVITHLRSGSNYHVQVAAKASSEMFNGYWSDWSEVTSRQTEHNVPTSKFFFENIQLTVGNTIKTGSLSTRWRPYARTDEPGFRYKIFISYGSTNVTKLVTHETTLNVAFKSNTSLDEVRLSGQYCNSVGCSVSDERALGLNQEWRPLAGIKLEMNEGYKKVYWQPLDEPCSARGCIVQICQSPRTGTTFEEMFANINLNTVSRAPGTRVCENIAVKTNCNSGSLSVYGNNVSPCKVYSAKVLQRCSSSQSEEIFIESKPSNEIRYNPIFPPMDFHVNEVSDNNHQGLNISWNRKYECNGGQEYTKLSAIYSPFAGAECNFTQCFEEASYEKIRNCSASQALISKNVFGGTTYKVGLGHCCSDDSVSKTGFPFCFVASGVKQVSTTIRAPGPPLHLTWNGHPKITLKWTPPLHRNGKLDGYTVFYGRTANKNHSIVHKTTDTSFEIPESCSLTADDNALWVRVSAYNVGPNGIQLSGPTVNASGITCVAGASGMSNFAGIFVGLAISLAFICIGLVLCHYHRKRIKDAVRKGLWPPIPEPMVVVSFQVHDEEQTFELTSEPLDTALNHTSAHDDLEKVDDINESIYRRGNVNASNNRHVDAVMPGERTTNHLMEERGCSSNHEERVRLLDDSGSQCLPEDSGLSSLRGVHRLCLTNKHSTKKGQSSGSNFTEYSTLSPLPPLLSLNSASSIPDVYPGTSLVCASRPTSWSSLLVTETVPRPNRVPSLRCYSENNLDYVRYCRENGIEMETSLTDIEQNRDSDTPTILYTKLATNSRGASTTSTNIDNPSSLNTLRRLTQRDDVENESESSQSLCDYVGGVDPYVTTPAHTEEQNEEMANYSKAATSSRRSSASISSQDSIDRLYAVVRQGDNHSPAGGEEIERTHPSINEYVTMDQALEMGEEGSSLPENDFMSVAGASNLAVAGDLDGLPGLEDSAHQAEAGRPSSSALTSALSEMGYISVADATQIDASASLLSYPQHR